MSPSLAGSFARVVTVFWKVSYRCALLGSLLLAASLALAAGPPTTAVAFSSNGKSVVVASQSGLPEFGGPDLQRLRTTEATAPELLLPRLFTERQAARRWRSQSVRRWRR